MENWKKIVLIISILIFVIILDLLLYFKTDKLMDNTQNDLITLEKKIDENNVEESKKAADKLNKNWEDTENILSFFIEHEEIENVSLKIVTIKENTKNEEFEDALEDIAETKHLLEHIKSKYNFNLKNIF